VPDKVTEATPRNTPSAPRNWRGLVWWGIAFAAIMFGYIDLARGGETLAPILLIAGYCIFVPVAILK